MSQTDDDKMRAWLAARAVDPHKHLHYTGSNATVADVERWLRTMIAQHDNLVETVLDCSHYEAIKAARHLAGIT